MRTTLEIEVHLFRALKRRAADQGATLKDVVNGGALRRSFLPPARQGKFAFKWKVDP